MRFLKDERPQARRRFVRLALVSMIVLMLGIYGWLANSQQPDIGDTSALFDHRVPEIHRIALDRLPPPFATRSALNPAFVTSRPAGARLHVPEGFSVSAWKTKLVNPRAMAVAPNGDVFVAESAIGRVVVLRQGAHGVVTDTVFARDLNKPFGIAFYPPGDAPRYVYIAETDAVKRYPYRVGNTKGPAGGPEVIIPDLPAGGYNNHWTRRLLFSPDGKRLYVSVGSAGNCDEEEERRAAILEATPEGKDIRIYASGLRNAVGLAWNPVNGRMWAAVNERDGLGDDLVPDFATSVLPGSFFGWPYYYMGANHDPRLPDRPDLRSKSLIPDVPLEAHCAAVSIAFYTGKAFPRPYWNDAFVGMHGSWNRAHRSGYKIVRLLMKRDGSAVGEYEDFVWGWAVPGGKVWGRPVDVAQTPDGALLVSDDGSGTIWKVAYAGHNP